MQKTRSISLAEGQQLFIGSTLLKTGTTLKKIGNAEKDFMQKSFVQFLHPLRSFLDNEMKTIMVCFFFYPLLMLF